MSNNSQRVKVFISDTSQESYNRLQNIISDHPEFEICLTKNDTKQHDTRAAQTLGSGLLTKRISDIFITVGIPAHIKGYQFLRDAIKLTMQNPSIINSITKELYPTIASQYRTTSSKVERAIRHAIEVGWSRGRIENINNIFGVKVYGHNDRPTNGEFIALIADKLMVEGLVSNTI